MFIGYARVSTRGQDLLFLEDADAAGRTQGGPLRIDHRSRHSLVTDRPPPENQGFSCRMSLSQVVENLRHDLLPGRSGIGPKLARMLDHLRAGDVVTITRLDRLARSTGDLLAIAERIKEAGAGLRSLAEPWADTTTPAGRMVLTVFAGIADFERSLIVERTSAGRIAAKARGVKFGPSPALSAEQIAHARQLIHDDKKPVAEVARLLGVHRATLYRALENALT